MNVKEQFELIQNTQLKELCLKNINPKWENNDASTLADAILSGVEWDKADGGFEFWQYILSMVKKDRIEEIDFTLEEPEEKPATFGIITAPGDKQMTKDQQAQRKARNRARFKSHGIEEIRERDTDAFRHHKKKLGYKS